MTVAELLARMAVFDSELRTGSGAAHEAIGTRALNMAQDAMEAIIATVPKAMQTHSTLTTTANVEGTDRPNDLSTGEQLLRLDALWMLDSSSHPLYMLDKTTIVGGHYPQAPPPLNLLITTVSPATGRPRKYDDEGPGGSLLWNPIPDAVYTLRWYGFQTKTTLIAPSTASANFAYPDIMADIIAAGAVRCIRIGKDDPTESVQALIAEMRPWVMKALRGHNRQGPSPRRYTQVHTS